MKIEPSPLGHAKQHSGHGAAPTYARPLGSAVSNQSKEKRQPVVLQQDRRRVQRVMLRVSVSVHVSMQGEQKSLAAVTMSVSSAGALLIMKQGVPADARLVLEHAQTKERVACRVTRPPREMPEGSHVSVEFDSPAPNFWRITFPPSDWRPAD